MNLNVLLSIALLLAILLLLFLYSRLHRLRAQLSLIQQVLKDIKEGNLNRRALTKIQDETRQICLDINEIASNSQAQLIQQKQTQQAYKQLMTSLSHDVKTPLASLVGYLEAVEEHLVTGEEKDQYIHVAAQKAQRLKQFVEHLFEWVKLDAREQSFHFVSLDFFELSRNIVADWVPLLESHGFTYEIEIPETSCILSMDIHAYTRILNNLMQNVLVHSQGTKVSLKIQELDQQVQVTLSDNGKGIAPEHLPHIFDRLYQCDHSRNARGNGLGLAITRELVQAHKGTILANSTPGAGTEFLLTFPKAR